MLEFVRSTIGDPDLRSPSGFDSGLRPPLRMTRRGGNGRPKLKFTLVRRISGVAFKVRIYAGNFFSFKANKKAFSCGRRGTTAVVDEESSGKTYFMPTPHPSAFGCHLLPLEKAFVCLCATT